MRAISRSIPVLTQRSRLLAASAAATAALVLTTTVADAQRATRVGPMIHVAPYAGMLITGDIISGPLGSNLTSANGPIVGAQLGVDLTPNIAIVGNLGYSRSDLRVGVPIIGGFNVGESTMWVYDGGIQLGVPIETAGGLGIRPFVQGGVGAITQRLNNSLVDSRGTNLAYNVGGGVDVNITPSLGLQLMVKDYIGRFDAEEGVGFGLNTGTTHNWALTAGLRLAF